MANVQPDKFTKIANELLDVVPQYQFNGTQLRIILVIWRYTYGFKRKQHSISISFLIQATGISKRQLQKEINNLIEKNVLIETQQASFNKPRIIEFNKDYDRWSIERSNTNELQVNQKAEVIDNAPLQVNNSTPLQVNDSTPKKESIKDSIKENIYNEIFNLYISKNIIQHKKITDPMKRAINGRLRDYSLDDIKKAIDNYAEVLHSDNHWFTHKYPLADLMRDKDIRKFLDEADPLNNFLIQGKPKKSKTINLEEFDLDD